MRKVAIYMRVSTEGQEDEETIKNQKMEIKNELAKYPNLVLLPDCIYEDDGWSGAILKRPALDKLRSDALDGLFDIVYVYDRGRIARYYWMQEVVINELSDIGIETISVADLNPKNDSEAVMAGMQGLFAQYERVKIKERMRIGKLRRVKEHKKLLGYNAKYGYKYLPRIKNGPDARDGCFVINEKEAKVVRMIFRWFADGKSKYWIREELYKLNITPPKAKNTVWSLGTIDRIPGDSTYMGIHYYNKSESIESKNPRQHKEYRRQLKNSRRARPKDEWLPVDVPAIVDKKLYDKVQLQKTRNKRTFQRNNKKNNYLLQGIVECPCGHARTGEGLRDSLYYRCTDRLTNVKDTRICFERGVSAPVLDDLIWRNVESLLTQPQLVFEQAKKWQEGLSPLQERQQILNERLMDLGEKESRFAKMYGEGEHVMSEQVYKENMHLLNEDRRKLVDEISAIQDELANKPLVPLEKLVDCVIKLVQDLDFSNKKQIIQRVVTKVVATKKEVTVWGKIPIFVSKETTIDDNSIYYQQNNNQENTTNLSEIGLNVKYRNRRPPQCRQVYPF